ncbi:hypothetical protein CNBM0010 [Cryptococcus deneoformans B-3501A]|uniref:hypothetical protein n=1 Tax=Cryptococcus deneoformans (strain B-3501A) TaxID=283643 RepID=UPI000042F810|nr:hypothetical protein CNBM0010 [Cryptococcus neoformans var. neoformans B-3501A]EAL17617.1 hypothetical protein CNBM0010 [Cryptococcus neoformans var. neoformans B-3501A]
MTFSSTRPLATPRASTTGLLLPEEKPWAWGVKNGVLDGVKARGTYKEVYNDPDVTAAYVGTPHVFHHRNAKDALLAGKDVLLEKPACPEVEEFWTS